jgi:hypothetical protein
LDGLLVAIFDDEEPPKLRNKSLMSSNLEEEEEEEEAVEFPYLPLREFKLSILSLSMEVGCAIIMACLDHPPRPKRYPLEDVLHG